MRDLLKNTKKLMGETEKGRGYKLQKQEKMDNGTYVLIYEKEVKGKSELVQVMIISGAPTLGVAIIRDAVKEMGKRKIKEKIIVGAGKVTRSAKNEMIANDIQFIPAKLVQMDILNHDFVPRHEIVPQEEAVEMLIKHQLSKDSLPQISHADPVAIVIGAKPGDFVKITRKSKTTDTNIIYRYCVIMPED